MIAPFDGALLPAESIRFYINTKEKYDDLLNAINTNPRLLNEGYGRSPVIGYMALVIGFSILAATAESENKGWPILGSSIAGFGFGYLAVDF